jgi:hypothetical protein
MKKLLFFMAMSWLGVTTARAQSGQKAFLLGGSAAILRAEGNHSGLVFQQASPSVGRDSDDGSTMLQFNLSPRLGYDFGRGLAAGVKADIAYARLRTAELTDERFLNSVSGGPFLRYYRAVGLRNKAFLEIQGGVGRTSASRVGDSAYNMQALQFAGSAGWAFFLREHFSLEVLVGYAYQNLHDPRKDERDPHVTNGIGIGIGLMRTWPR